MTAVETARRPKVGYVVARPWPGDPSRLCDPLGGYADRFWTPVLGPSVIALQRSLVRQMSDFPSGMLWEPEDQAVRIGVSVRRIDAVVDRLVRFNMGQLDVWDDAATLWIYERWPLLSRERVARLPFSLRRQHEPYDPRPEKGDIHAHAG